MARDLAGFVTGLGSDHLVAVVVAGLFGLLLVAVVLTSVLLRRPAVAPDGALPEADDDAKVELETLEGGVEDASGLRFRDVEDVIDTLARVSLVPATSWRDGEVLVVEMPVTASSREATETGGRRHREKHVCRWETGFLAEGLRRFASGALDVRETACRAAGAPACRFMVRGALPTR